MQKKIREVKSMKDILSSNDFLDKMIDRKKYISHEFQDFGYRMAVNLNDMEHKSLYMKLAKREDRNILQQAMIFAMDYPSAKNKGKIFMWKLGELKRERQAGVKKEKESQTSFLSLKP